MFAPFRLTRLLFVALAACAVTWAMAASALARPVLPLQEDQTTGARPEFKDVAGDVQASAASRPDFKVVPGDVKSDADRARAIPTPEPNAPVSVPAAPDDDTSTVALILSIAAILTALGAVTLTVTRPSRGALRA
jgi:hypothetical protein